MTIYTDDELTEAYLSGKNGKPLPKPEGIELVQVTRLAGIEYDMLYMIQNKGEANGKP